MRQFTGACPAATGPTDEPCTRSPLLANLFKHYAFDSWMPRTYPDMQFARYPCRSQPDQILASTHAASLPTTGRDDLVRPPDPRPGLTSSDYSTESPPLNHLGKPDAGNLPVRFEEGDGDGVGRTIPILLNCKHVQWTEPPLTTNGSSEVSAPRFGQPQANVPSGLAHFTAFSITSCTFLSW